MAAGRVSNFWILLAVLTGLWLRGMDFLAASVPVLILVFFLFHFRMMGAGDGKMMAVMAGFLGVEDGLSAIFLGLLIGACWGVLRMWRHKSLRIRMRYLFAYGAVMFHGGECGAYERLSGRMDGQRIPLAACLAAGGYLYLFVSGAVKLGGMI